MKITEEILKKWDACYGGRVWFSSQPERDGKKIVTGFVKSGEHLDWANWLICRMFSRKQKIMYAIYAVEQVIDIYEKQYPTDKRPRLAIEAAKNVLKNNTTKTRDAAGAAGTAAGAAARDAAGAAGTAAWAARDAAGTAAWAAAWEAARAAGTAAWEAARAAAVAAEAAGAAWDAARAAGTAAWEAARAAWDAAREAAGNKMKTKILKYGLSLLDKRK